MNGSVGGLRRKTFNLYTSIRHSINQSLMEASRRLKKMLDGEETFLQQGVLDAICSAGGVVQKPFVDAPGVVENNLSLIAGH